MCESTPPTDLPNICAWYRWVARASKQVTILPPIHGHDTKRTPEREGQAVALPLILSRDQVLSALSDCLSPISSLKSGTEDVLSLSLAPPSGPPLLEVGETVVWRFRQSSIHRLDDGTVSDSCLECIIGSMALSGVKRVCPDCFQRLVAIYERIICGRHVPRKMRGVRCFHRVLLGGHV